MKPLHTQLLPKQSTASASKNIRVASSEKLVITSKFDVSLRYSTMIDTLGTGNPISISASDFGLSHEVDKNGCDFLRDSPLSKSFFCF